MLRALVLLAGVTLLGGCRLKEPPVPVPPVTPVKPVVKVPPVSRSLDLVDKPLSEAGQKGAVLQEGNAALKVLAAAWEAKAAEAASQVAAARAEVDRLNKAGKIAKPDIKDLETLLDDLHTRNSVLVTDGAVARVAVNRQGDVIRELNRTLGEVRTQLNATRAHAEKKESQVTDLESKLEFVEADRLRLGESNASLNRQYREAAEELNIQKGKVKELQSYKTFFFGAAILVVVLGLLSLYLKFKPGF